MKNKDSKVQYGRILQYYIREIKKYPYRFWAIIVCGLIGTFGAVIGPTYLKKLVDIFTHQPTAELSLAALRILGIYILFRVVNVAFIRTSNGNLAVMDATVMANLRELGFSRMMRHSHSFFTDNFSGSLTQKVNKFAKSYESIFDVFIQQIVAIGIWITLTLYIISSYSLTAALIIVIGSSIFLAFNFIYVRNKAKYDRESSEADSRFTAGVADSISNHLVVQLFSGNTYENTHIRNLAQTLRQFKTRQWLRHEVMFVFQGIIFMVIEYAILRYSINGWRAGIITAGTLVLFQIYFLGLLSRLLEFSNVFRRLSEAFSEAQEMVDILDLPMEVVDSPHASKQIPSHGSIEFKDVSFAYNAERKLIENLSLSIQDGEKVALVGVSGAGKSTLFKLLLRMYDRTDGMLVIDDKPIESYSLDTVREAIGFVPQEPTLFHRSLMENIRYGNKNASDALVRQASEAAECLEFIEKLPLGFDTLVGERGVKLSGGERQRVAIARAILKNAPILLLDEATSSLDSHSELEIQKALERLMENKTVIAIAHRLSTIKKMDRIIVLENGAIVEEGTHDSLLKKKTGVYKKLWGLQVGGFITD